MTAHSLFSRLFASCLLMLSFSAIASDDYYWLSPDFNLTADSPSLLCEKIVEIEKSRGGKVLSKPYVTRASDPLFHCNYNFESSGGSGYVASRPMSRRGNTCPSGWTYTPSIVDGSNQCVPPPEPDKCLLTKGSTNFSLSFQGPRADFQPGVTIVSPVNTRMCDSNCSYEFSGGGATNCGTLVGGDPSQNYCVFEYKGVGQACLPTDEPINSHAPPNPDPPVDPNDPTDPRNNCGRGYAWSGTTCVKYWDPDNPPDPSNPDPNTGGGNSGGNNGGGNNGGGNNGGGTDPGGDNGGGGGGGGGTDPGGKGDGAASSTCDKPPTYSKEADPLLGEILIQQWHTLCAGEELKHSDLASGLESQGFVNADSLDNVLSEDATNMDNEVRSIISGLYTSGPSSACPVKDDTITTRWGVIRLPWTMSCSIFNVISAVIFFFSYLAAGWIVFNALAKDD